MKKTYTRLFLIFFLLLFCSTFNNIKAQLTIDSVVVTDVTCYGYNDGSITVYISGGTPDFRYGLFEIGSAFPIEQSEWISDESYTFTNLDPNTVYTFVAVRDDTGAEISSADFDQISEPDELIAHITPDPAEVCAGDALQLDGNPDGGTPPYSHSWIGDTDPLSATNIPDPTFETTTPGDYLLLYSLFDDNGCAVTESIDITVFESIDGGQIEEDQFICSEDTPETFENVVSPSGGDGDWDYQWQYRVSGGDWEDIADANDLDYEHTDPISETTEFRRLASNNCGTESSNIVTVSLFDAADGGEIEDDQEICYNTAPDPFNNVELPSGGFGDWDYKWQYRISGGDWEDIAGATDIDYEHTDQLTETTEFRRVATNACGTAESNIITVTVFDDIESGGIEDDQEICHNTIPDPFDNVTAPSGGHPDWDYQWQLRIDGGDWENIDGANDIDYHHNEQLTETTEFRRIESNICGTLESNIITVFVFDELDGGLIDFDQEICYNSIPDPFQNITNPSGGDGVWNIQWQLRTGGEDWEDITGADELNYHHNEQLTENTDFRRVASNNCGPVSSNIITVTVFEEIDGGQIGENQEICYGSTPAPFTNVTSPSGGYPDWDFQWQYRVTVSGWSNIPGATNIEYEHPDPITETTWFRRRALNDCGSDLSNNVRVEVFDELDGGEIEENQEICFNEIPEPFENITSPSGGDVDWNYQWQYRDSGGVWNNIAGANDIDYHHNEQLTETTDFRRVASNDCGIVESNSITVSVFDELDGGEIEENQEICYNEIPEPFENTTSPSGGDGDWNYQWQYRDSGGVWNNIPGANDIDYHHNEQLTETTDFRRVASNDCGPVESNTITVIVFDELDGGEIEDDQEICFNEIPEPFENVTAPSGGNGSWDYIWQYRDSGGVWINIPGANDLDYDHTDPLTETTEFRRVASNDCGIVESNSITVTVFDELDGGEIEDDQEICFNEIPEPFENTTSPSGGDVDWNYQWQYRDSGGVWNDIPGANNLDYEHTDPLTETTEFRRVASNDCGIVESNSITVSVFDELDGGEIEDDQEICFNEIPEPFENRTSPSGGDGDWNYQWQLRIDGSDWNDIGGANDIDYHHNEQLTETTEFRRVASNDCGPVESNTITVTVFDELDGGVIEENQEICFNEIPEPFENTTSPSGGDGDWNYQWQYRDSGGVWNNIAGANDIDYHHNEQLTETTEFRRVASNDCGPVESNTITVTVFDELDGGEIEDDQEICFNEIPEPFENRTSPSGGDGDWNYQWQYRDSGGVWNNIAGANDIDYHHNEQLTETTDFRRVASNDCEPVESNTITVIVFEELDGGEIEDDQEICFNEIPEPFENITSPSGGDGDWNYQWQLRIDGSDWNDIGGANDIDYHHNEQLTETTDFRRVASNDCGIVESNSITVTVFDELDGGEIEDDQEICFNEIPEPFENITSPSGGDVDWNYQWQYRDSGGVWNNIAGANDIDYHHNEQLTETTDFRRVASNFCGTVESNVIVVDVLEELNGGLIEEDQSICHNEIPEPFENVALPTGGEGDWSYQWQYRNGGGVWADIGGANDIDYDHGEPLTETTEFRRVASNDCGPIESNTITVTVFDELIIQVTGTDPSTPSENDGEIQVEIIQETVANYDYYLYKWDISDAEWQIYDSEEDTPNNIHIFENIEMGEYRVEVIDNNDCTAEDFIDFLTINFSIESTNVKCYGYCDGTITLEFIEGVTEISSIEWLKNDNPYDMTPHIDPIEDYHYINLCPGSYEVIIEDSFGYIYMDSTTIYEPNQLLIQITETAPSGSAETDGEIEVEIIQETSPDYDYLLYRWDDNMPGWILEQSYTSTPNTIHTFQNLGIGEYMVAVIDDNGCVAVKGSSLYSLLISLESTDASCYDYCDGTITLEIIDGEDDISSIDWFKNGNPYDMTPHIDPEEEYHYIDLCPGFYEVIVEDIYGNDVSESITISEPEEIVLNIIATDPTAHDVEDGSIIVEILTAPGEAFPDFTYNLFIWDEDISDWILHDTEISSEFNHEFDNLGIGDYLIEVIDSNDCRAEEDASLSALFLEISATEVTCYGDCDGTITLTITGKDYESIEWFKDGDNYDMVPHIDPIEEDYHYIDLCPGFYEVTVTDHDDNEASASITVAEPDEIVIDDSSILYTDTICYGTDDGEISIEATGGTGDLEYTLYRNGSQYGDSQINDGTFTDLPPGTYYIEITDENNCGPTISEEFIIEELDDLHPGEDEIICYGDTIQIGPEEGVDGMIYHWTSNPGGAYISDPNTLNPFVSPEATTDFILTEEHPVLGCFNSATITVEVQGEYNAPDTINICQGDTIIIGKDSIPNHEYLWEPVDSTSSYITVNPDENTKYTLYEFIPGTSGVEGDLCHNIYEFIVIVNPLPKADAGENIEICLGDTIQIGGDYSYAMPANEFQWTSEPEDSSISDANTSNPFVSPTVTTTYTFRETYIETGCYKTNTVVVTVYPDEEITANNHGPYCEGGSIELFAEPDGMFYYSWEGPDGWMSAQQNPVRENATIEMAGTYILKTEREFGANNLLCSFERETNVEINEGPKPEGDSFVSSDYAFCSLDEITEPISIGKDSVDGYSYYWESEPLDETLDSEAANPYVNPEETTKYILQITDESTGCMAYDSVIVFISDLHLTQDDNPLICEYEDEVIMGVHINILGGVQPYRYYWTDFDGNTVSRSRNPGFTRPLDPYYIFTVVDSLGCYATDHVFINDIPTPRVELEVDPSNYPMYYETLTFTAIPDNYHNYEFFVDDVSVQSGENNVFITDDIENEQQVKVVTTYHSCTDTSNVITIFITKIHQIELPNAFIPDSEFRENRKFGEYIVYKDELFHREDLDIRIHMKVFSRWGQKIYEGNSPWGGDFRGSGNIVTPGTYYYVATIYDSENNSAELKGAVTVIVRE